MPNVRRRLLVLCKYFPVLSETFVVDHVAGMVQSGWDVTVVASYTDESEAARIRAMKGVNFQLVRLPNLFMGTPVQRLALAWRALLLMSRVIPAHVVDRAAWRCAIPAVALRDVIEEHKPDVIHAHFGQNGVTAALATNLPLIVNFHGHDFTSWTKRWGWSLYRDALRDAVIVVHSDFAERTLVGNGMRPIRRVTMGVDLDRFVPPEKQEAWPRPLRLLSVGRLIPQKGHDVVLRALAILRKSMPEFDVRLRIVGKGPEHNELVRLAIELELSDYLEGPAPVASSDMPSVYRSADVLIAASQSTADGWEEGFCRVAVEGMACGLPIVASPCGGLPDTVALGGVVAATQEADMLACAVEQIVRSGNPRYWMDRALASARRFRIDTMYGDYQRCTDAMLERNDRSESREPQGFN